MIGCPHLLQWLPSGGGQTALSALAWVEEETGRVRRLVSGGLDGTLTEWDLTKLQPSSITDSYGGAVWALAVQPSVDAGAGAIPH